MRAAATIAALILALGATLVALPNSACAQFYGKDIRHLKQDDPAAFDPATSTGENNCASTAMIMCLDWWARHGYPNLVAPNATLADLYQAVRQIAHQGDIGKEGMGWHKMKKALEEWMRKHDPNHQLKVTGHDRNMSREAVFNQFIPGATGMGQDVIWLGESTTQTTKDKDVMASHAMTMEWVSQSDQAPLPDGSTDGRYVGMA